MESSYWQKFTTARLVRRRALTAAGGIALGGAALSLIGCGGSDSDGPKGPIDRSGLLAFPTNTTAQAKPGGTLKDFATGDITHFDANMANAAPLSGNVHTFFYLRLLKFAVAEVSEPGRRQRRG